MVSSNIERVAVRQRGKREQWAGFRWVTGCDVTPLSRARAQAERSRWALPGQGAGGGLTSNRAGMGAVANPSACCLVILAVAWPRFLAPALVQPPAAWVRYSADPAESFLV